MNSHAHFDHSGGLRTYVDEGATIVTHETNKAFFEKSLAAPRTVRPDKLAQSGKKAVVEGFKEKHVMSDGTRTIELHLIQGSNHDEGLIMAYLPKEQMLIEADLFDTHEPQRGMPTPAARSLYTSMQRSHPPYSGSQPGWF